MGVYPPSPPVKLDLENSEQKFLRLVGVSMRNMFKSLPQPMRTFALVGYYLQTWSVMETNLDETLAKALHLDVLAGLVVAKNLGLRDKVHVLKAILQLDVFGPTRNKYLKVAGRIDKLATSDRNTVAHTMFLTHEESDGVVFYVKKARGKLNLPSIVWSLDDCLTKCDELFDICDDLKELQSVFGKARIAKALQKDTDIPANWFAQFRKDDTEKVP